MNNKQNIVKNINIKKTIIPIEQELIVKNINNETNNELNKKVEENNMQYQHLNKSEYTQIFLSDKEVKRRLIELRDNKINKEFNIDKKCILSPLMIDQFIKHKPLDMDEFRNTIPLKLRTSIDREQLVYINDIFEILEMADE